jgi:glucose-6-phosphate isomerase
MDRLPGHECKAWFRFGSFRHSRRWSAFSNPSNELICAIVSGESGARPEAEDRGVGLLPEYSKHRITDQTLGLLLQLAEQSKLRERIEAMFSGRRSISPRRAGGAACGAAGEARCGDRGGWEECCAGGACGFGSDGGFADRVRTRPVEGIQREGDQNVVNIGIGGSDLGPVMAYEAAEALLRGVT